MLAVVTGEPLDLLPFDAVWERLKLKRMVERGVEEVPLSRIVGTVGRERDFNRIFLPRQESLRRRWNDMVRLLESPAGYPPVELYRVGEVDFVVDGHHRVSVARALGAPTIEARVKEFLTPVPLPANASIEDVLLREGLADFLDATGLVPDSEDDFRVTAPKGYEQLLEHISVHRYYRGIELSRPVSWEEAVESWKLNVYEPMVDRIRRSGILEHFPDRTVADLYLYTMEHRHHLRQRYGRAGDKPMRAVRHFALTQTSRKRKKGGLLEWWRRRRERFF
jgi:hypothetical protein